ncbi:diacylglycerol kinase family lipid kinase [bacterium]|nr:diacylglycerol kinase family lipid kinase [bacterium]
MTDSGKVRKVRALYNPKSGLGLNSAETVRAALQETWDVPGIDLTYQVSKSAEDGIAKTRRAVEDGVDTVIVIGGDGMVNTIGSALVGTETALAVLPAGSGNGFARHFDIPLQLEKASKLLFEGVRQKIDVGFVDDRPFFVTCGLAWDADLVESFEESPVRGVLPYVFAGIYEWFRYEPQVFHLDVDGVELTAQKPIVLTVANLTQYGGGAQIAPDASPIDGTLELVEVPDIDPVTFVTQMRRLFDGSIKEIEQVRTRSFKRMVVKRERDGAVQVDGELLKKGKEFVIEVRPLALEIIVPKDRQHKRPIHRRFRGE